MCLLGCAEQLQPGGGEADLDVVLAVLRVGVLVMEEDDGMGVMGLLADVMGLIACRRRGLDSPLAEKLPA